MEIMMGIMLRIILVIVLGMMPGKMPEIRSEQKCDYVQSTPLTYCNLSLSLAWSWSLAELIVEYPGDISHGILHQHHRSTRQHHLCCFAPTKWIVFRYTVPLGCE